MLRRAFVIMRGWVMRRMWFDDEGNEWDYVWTEAFDGGSCVE